MGARQFDFALAIGGAAGQGIATPGDILARIFVRRGLHLNTYNAYQSIIRGGHIFLTVRVSDQEVLTHGDRWDLLLCLDQSTMDRHLRHMQSGSKVIFNAGTIEPEAAAKGVALCPIPVSELTGNSRNAVMQNTVALGVIIALLRMDFKVLETAMQSQFGREVRFELGGEPGTRALGTGVDELRRAHHEPRAGRDRARGGRGRHGRLDRLLALGMGIGSLATQRHDASGGQEQGDTE